MTTLHVQFADTSDAVIVGYFGAPQTIANAGTVEQSDPRWKTFYDANRAMQPYIPQPV